MPSSQILGGRMALQQFLSSASVSPVNIIPPQLHNHLSPPHEVCDIPDQAAHYNILGPNLGAAPTQQFASLRVKAVQFIVLIALLIFLYESIKVEILFLCSLS
jgi:hypothetical protein